MTFIEVHSIILIVIGSLELLLAIYFFATHSGSRLRFFYGMFVLGVAVWVLSLGISQILATHNIINQALDALPYFGAVLIGSFFLPVAWLFPFPTKRMSWIEHVLVTTPILFFGAGLLFSNQVIGHFYFNEHYGATGLYGPYFSFFSIWFLAYWLYGVLCLTKKYPKSQGQQRWILKYFIIAILGSGLIGVTTNLVIPALTANESLWWLGSEASVIWLSVTAFLLTKSSR